MCLMKRVSRVSVQLGGGQVDGLVEALQCLGLTEGVRILRDAELRDDKLNAGNERQRQRHLNESECNKLTSLLLSVQSEATVDSGFGSQPMEEEEPASANQ